MDFKKTVLLIKNLSKFSLGALCLTTLIYALLSFGTEREYFEYILLALNWPLFVFSFYCVWNSYKRSAFRFWPSFFSFWNPKHLIQNYRSLSPNLKKLIVFSLLLLFIFLYSFQAQGFNKDWLSFAIGLWWSTFLFPLFLLHLKNSWLTTISVLVYFLALALFFLIGLGHSSYTAKYGHIELEAVIAIAATNFQEAKDYTADILSYGDLILYAVVFALVLKNFPVSFSRVRNSQNSILRGLSTSLFFLIFSIFVYTMFWARYRFYELHSYFRNFSQTALYTKEYIKHKRQKKDLRAIPASDFSGTVVVIVGESTGRHHMQIYDYFRPTSPKLNALKKKSELLVYKDAISPMPGTIPSLLEALSTADINDGTSFPGDSVHDIISVANAAEIKTFWLSNQKEMTLYDSPLVLIAKESFYTKFFDTQVWKKVNTYLTDDTLLPPLQKILHSHRTEKKLIFLHFMGTHTPYCRIFPPEYAEFKDFPKKKFYGSKKVSSKILRQLICYENAILYQDDVIANIIYTLKKEKQPAALVYFSDHGDAALLGTAHYSTRFSAYQIEIPFFVWFNSSFTKRYEKTVQAARTNLNQPFSITDMTHSLCVLLRIQTPICDPKRNIFSRKYLSRKRTSFRKRIHYDAHNEQNDYRTNTRAVLGSLKKQIQKKVWAHRVNSLGKLLDIKHIFSGVELDLNYDSKEKKFFVYNQEAENTGLSLEEWLQAAERSGAPLRLFLDWQNVKKTDTQAVLRHLSALDKKYFLKKRSVIQPAAHFPEIQDFSSSGFVLSYKLPAAQIQKCLAKCRPDELRLLADTLQKKIKGYAYSALSFSHNLSPFVEKYFASFIRKKKLKVYAVETSVISHRSAAAEKISEIFKSPLFLNALIIRSPSDFDI